MKALAISLLLCTGVCAYWLWDPSGGGDRTTASVLELAPRAHAEEPATPEPADFDIPNGPADEPADLNTPAPESGPVAASEPLRGRLPRYMGQIGLSDPQREEIYRVQAQYRPGIKQLEDRLDLLRRREQADILRVLTPEQREAYEKVIEEAKERRAQRSNSKK